MTVEQLLDQLHDLLLHHRPQWLGAEQAEVHLRAHHEALSAALSEHLAPWFLVKPRPPTPRATPPVPRGGFTPGQRFNLAMPLSGLPDAAERIGALRTTSVVVALRAALDAPVLDAETMASLSEEAAGVEWWEEAGLTKEEVGGAICGATAPIPVPW